MHRRHFVGATLTAGAAGLLGLRSVDASRFTNGKLVIYKSPTCGCCSKWVEHVQAAGFQTEVHDLDNVGAIKTKHGVPADLASCHTALIDSYVVEGHVPADVIQKLIKDKPAVVGIAVPGMPLGSPGMEVGTRKDSYEVIAFAKNGKTSVFAKR